MLKIYLQHDNGGYIVGHDIGNESQPTQWYGNEVEAMEKIVAIAQNYMATVAVINENKLAEQSEW
jgi:hypothetical protein